MFAVVVNLANPGSLVQSLRAHPVFPLIEWVPSVSVPIPAETRPVLYVGHAQTQQLLGRKLAALENQLDERTWWAYSPAESPMHFLRQFEAFLLAVPKVLLTCVSWQSLDPLIHGPFDRAGLQAYVQGLGPKLTVFEHRFGFCWWSADHPRLVSGLGADGYYTHAGIARRELREWFRLAAEARQGQLVEDGPDARVSSWFKANFHYTLVDIVRILPWLIAMKAERAI